MPGRLPSTDVLCAYLEPLASGARAVVLGDATSGAAERLLELGARSVHVYDPDVARAAKARPPRGAFVQALPQHDFDVRDGAFELAIVLDAAAIPDAPAALARLRRILGARGALLVCASNPDVTGEGVAYYALYDLVALQFASVRMLGVLPFAASALVELGLEDEEPDVSVDTQLVSEPPQPFAFCALASQSEDVRLSPYAIIQQHGAFEAAPAARVAPDADRVAPDADRVSELEAALADTSERLDEALRVGEAVSELERDLEQLKALAAVAEDSARAAEERVHAAEARARAADEATRAAEEAALAAKETARAAEETARAAIEDLRSAEARARAAEEVARRSEDIARSASALAAESAAKDDAAADVAALEAALKERASVVAELEREVLRREKIAKELVLALEQRTPDEAVRAKLDALALELARRHSELEATRWRVAELEQKLAARAQPADAQREVDVLRQALAQEHEARKRVESGEELARAREELQKQAVLIEQARKSEGAGDETSR